MRSSKVASGQKPAFPTQTSNASPGVLKGKYTQIWEDPNLQRVLDIHDKCISMVPLLQRFGWVPDMSDPLDQEAMQLVDKAATRKVEAERCERAWCQFMTAGEAAARGRAPPGQVAAEAVPGQHDLEPEEPPECDTAVRNKQWKCELCAYDHTLLSRKASCSRSKLGNLPGFSKKTTLCQACAVNLRNGMRRLGPSASQEQLAEMIKVRTISARDGKRAAYVQTQKEDMGPDKRVRRSAQRE